MSAPYPPECRLFPRVTLRLPWDLGVPEGQAIFRAAKPPRPDPMRVVAARRGVTLYEVTTPTRDLTLSRAPFDLWRLLGIVALALALLAGRADAQACTFWTYVGPDGRLVTCTTCYYAGGVASTVCS